MPDLEHRQEKIQEKRKKTPWREFLIDVCSWKTFSFYKRGAYISRYPVSDRSLHIVTQDEFLEGRDALVYIDYDKNIHFFDQFKSLFERVPLAHMVNFYTNENVTYADCNFGAKDVYLSSTVGVNAERVLYSSFVYSNVDNVISGYLVTDNSSQVYQSKIVSNSRNIFYARYIIDSANIRFSSNLIGCEECIQCNELQNQRYCIGNIQYSKEEYLIKKQEILSKKDMFPILYSEVSTKAKNYGSKNIEGNALYFSSDVENGYDFTRLRSGRNIVAGDGVNGCENFYDSFDVGINCHDLYGTCSWGEDGTHDIYIAVEGGSSTYIFYSYLIESCHYCLGCVGLKNKQFCIFNKQYTKEERHKKVDEIFTKMEEEGTLGEFFPGSMNPFYFNDTAAYLIDDSFTKEEVEAKGYLRRDDVVKVDIPQGVEVVKTSELGTYEGWCVGARRGVSTQGSVGTEFIPSDATGDQENAVRHIDPSILKKVIQDEQGNVYKIVKMEYDFLMKHGLPLPRLHRLERLKKNFKIS